MIILGISGALGHDASACLVVDGRVVALVEEERLARVKGASGMLPTAAVRTCVQIADLPLNDIDAVAFGWDPTLDPSNARMHNWMREFDAAPEFSRLRGKPRHYFDHHSCHAASALAYAGHAGEAFVLVMDGRGEDGSTSIYSSSNGRLSLLARSDVASSLGSFYAAATRYCGLGRDGQGKLMGLAAYGSPVHDFSELMLDDLRVLEPWPQDPAESTTGRHATVKPWWHSRITSVFGPPEDPDREVTAEFRLAASNTFTDTQADVAASAQATLERLGVELVQHCLERNPDARILITGGVGLNCALNGLLVTRFPSTEFGFLPIPHDVGTSMGAACLLASEYGEQTPTVTSAYLGAGWTDSQIHQRLRTYGLQGREPADVGSAVTDLLLQGKVGGWFQGRAEVGPRALGHRSIIASPWDSTVVDRINRRIKGREAWRPFGPSVRESDMPQVFGVTSTPFMIQATTMRTSKQERLRAICHVDGSSRPHSVSPSSLTHERYKGLLAAMESATGFGGVLNTSFNLSHEPIVYTPTDAARTFYASGLDFLAIGPFLLEK